MKYRDYVVDDSDVSGQAFAMDGYEINAFADSREISPNTIAIIPTPAGLVFIDKDTGEFIDSRLSKMTVNDFSRLRSVSDVRLKWLSSIFEMMKGGKWL